jgi:small subunit ribosomal protein S4
VIGVRERSKSLEVIVDYTTGNTSKHGWLDWNKETLSGKILNAPSRDQIPEAIKEQLIVELYSK